MNLENETEFDFKPINEGLGFHRKVKPLDGEADSDETFSFSTLGPGTLGSSSSAKSQSLLTPQMDATSREQSKGLLSSSPAASVSASVGKAKHNSKSVSDLIAALPPSFDVLNEAAAPTTSSGANALRKSPLFSAPSGLATPGAPAAASMAAEPATSAPTSRARGFLKMPIGRNDYSTSGAASIPASIDENVAKTFPSVFPHLGSLAGQPAAAAVKAATKKLAPATIAEAQVDQTVERPLAAHFGSAILDTLVSVGLGCILLAIALSVTDANLLLLLENTRTDRETVAALLFLFVAGGLLYALAARSFVGATLGEWSYEIRVGASDMRQRWYYPILVMWRGALVAATGFVLFPILSLLAGTDVLKSLTGLGLVGIDGVSSMDAGEKH